MDFTKINEQINARVTCTQVLTDLCGLEVRTAGRTTVLCPNHNDTHYGSCWVKEHGIHCFACGYHQDTVGVLQKVRGLSYIAAVKLISQTYGLNLPIDAKEENEVPKPTLRIDAADLALLGILDTVSFKKLYAENRTMFWDFIEASIDHIGQAFVYGEEETIPEKVAAELHKRAEATAAFVEKLRNAKSKNTPDTLLLIKQHQE